MTRSRATLAFLLVATLLGCPGAQRAAAEAPDGGPAKLPTGVITVQPVGREPIPLQVELALTRPDQARGLMHRPSLEDGHGMLFIFPFSKEQHFWMKNTLIALDMIFIDDEGKVVGVVRDAAPLTTTSRFVPAPSRSVLEVPGGWTKANGVDVGATVRDQTLPEGVTVAPDDGR